MAQITLRSLEFSLLPFGGGFSLHARFGQRARFGLGSGARFSQRLRFRFRRSTRRRKRFLLHGRFLGLLARQCRSGFVGTVALFLFFGNFYVQCDPCRLRSSLCALCFFDRAFFRLPTRSRFHIQARAQLRLALGTRARLDLRLLARQCKCRSEFGVVIGLWCRCVYGRRRGGALNLASRGRSTILRWFE